MGARFSRACLSPKLTAGHPARGALRTHSRPTAARASARGAIKLILHPQPTNPLTQTPPPVGPCFRRNSVSCRPKLQQNQTGLPNHNPKPTPAWLGGAMRRSRAITKKRTIQAHFLLDYANLLARLTTLGKQNGGVPVVCSRCNFEVRSA